MSLYCGNQFDLSSSYLLMEWGVKYLFYKSTSTGQADVQILNKNSYFQFLFN